jgi:hypothetical protein
VIQDNYSSLKPLVSSLHLARRKRWEGRGICFPEVAQLFQLTSHGREYDEMSKSRFEEKQQKAKKTARRH